MEWWWACGSGALFLVVCVLVAWLRAESAAAKAKRVANQLRLCLDAVALGSSTAAEDRLAEHLRQITLAALDGPGCRLWLVRHGVIVLLINSAARAEAAANVQLWSFRSFATVCRTRQARAAVVASGLERRLASLALAAFANHAHDVGVVQWALRAVAAVAAAGPGARKAVVDANIPQFVMRALAVDRVVPPLVASAGAIAVRALAFSPDARRALGDAGAAPRAVDLLRRGVRDGNERAMCALCGAIEVLALCGGTDPGNVDAASAENQPPPPSHGAGACPPPVDLRPALIENRAIQAVIDAMAANPESAPLQAHCFNALRNIAANDKCYRLAVVNAGGLWAVVAAMATHPQIATLQIKGMLCIAQLAVEKDYRCKNASDDCVKAVIAAMSRHPANKRLHRVALWGLARGLSAACSFAARKTASTRGVKAINVALSRWSKDEDIQHWGKAALRAVQRLLDMKETNRVGLLAQDDNTTGN